MKILVIGDRIVDFYRFGHATRICPEAPVPVIVEDTKDYREGGAALVHQQLLQLTDGIQAQSVYGSTSLKERIFADGRLICRVDRDGTDVDNDFEDEVLLALDGGKPEILIVSDYGKGAFTQESAKRIMRKADLVGSKVLVDAKNNWSWYPHAFAFFPNKNEAWCKELGWGNGVAPKHVIQKLGADGCRVDGVEVPTDAVEARDTTGAGDIFIAAFAYAMIFAPKFALTSHATYANFVAGISVTKVGTHVVTKEELDD